MLTINLLFSFLKVMFSLLALLQGLVGLSCISSQLLSVSEILRIDMFVER